MFLVRANTFFLFVWMALLSHSATSQNPIYSSEKRPVEDQALFFSRDEKLSIEQYLHRVRQMGGPQLAVVTLKDLGGEPIEQVAIKWAERWKLGSAAKDDGLILLFSRDERSIRIEVGQGLEGDITDAFSKRVIEEILKPNFQKGFFGPGVEQALRAIVFKIHPEWTSQGDNSQHFQARQETGPREISLVGKFIYLIILLFLLLTPLGRTILFAMILAGGRGSSRGGGGFGGYSGGGGGFSGGGASGRW